MVGRNESNIFSFGSSDRERRGRHHHHRRRREWDGQLGFALRPDHAAGQFRQRDNHAAELRGQRRRRRSHHLLGRRPDDLGQRGHRDGGGRCQPAGVGRDPCRHQSGHYRAVDLHHRHGRNAAVRASTRPPACSASPPRVRAPTAMASPFATWARRGTDQNGSPAVSYIYDRAGIQIIDVANSNGILLAGVGEAPSSVPTERRRPSRSTAAARTASI